MPVKVNSIDSGITIAVIRAARRLPRNRNSTPITSTAPSSRLRLTVAMALSTSTVRSYTGDGAARPRAGSRLISTILLSTASATRAAVLADQHEDGAQHHLAPVVGGRAACAARAPMPTVATSATRTGDAVDGAQTTMLPMSATDLHLAWRAQQVLLAAAFRCSRRRRCRCCAPAPSTTSARVRP